MYYFIVSGNVRGLTEVCLMVARGWCHYLDGPYCPDAWLDH